jgi:hypothetical protein
MTHILHYDGHYFRIDVVEVIDVDDAGKKTYVSWCSEGVRELKKLPGQASSLFVSGSPLPKHDEALQFACEWIKKRWNAREAKPAHKAGDKTGVLYKVRLFKGDDSLECEFEEFADAKSFARTAEKIVDIRKVGITNNESPQYLTVWEKET